jgi:RNA polymerase sigma-70 factor, ECF subfamily
VSAPPSRPGCTDGSGGREAILALLPPLRGYARSLTGGDEHAADDLVQDTLVLALQAWDRFTPGTNLKAWLFRILHNRHHTVRGRRHRLAEVGADDLEHRATVPAFQEGRAELRHFKAAFARLPASQREPLVLWAVHGLPYERIAEVCGCEVGAVKSRMSRARTALKAMVLGDRPIGDPVVTPPPARPRPRAASLPIAPAGPVPVAPAAAVPALVPSLPAANPVRPALARPARCAAGLARAERCPTEALRRLARQETAEPSPEVTRRAFALVLAHRGMLPREMPGADPEGGAALP